MHIYMRHVGLFWGSLLLLGQDSLISIVTLFLRMEVLINLHKLVKENMFCYNNVTHFFELFLKYMPESHNDLYQKLFLITYQLTIQALLQYFCFQCSILYLLN